MATESPRGKNVYFSYQEATAGTPDTNCFFIGSGPFMVKPPHTPLQESDKGKMGSGEYGTRAETQAYWSEFSYTSERLSEIAYFWAFATGKEYTVVAGTASQQHLIQVLTTANRLLPTFTIEYGIGGTSNNAVHAHCIINEITLTASKGGTGKLECTVNGFCNTHSVTDNVFALLTAGSMATAENSFNSEPLVNIRSIDAFVGTGVATTIDTPDDFTWTGTNLTATPTTITTLLDGFTLSMNNGLTADMLARSGGDGILNDQNRGDPSIEFELLMRKDNTVYNPGTPLLADTQLAMEFLYQGKLIGVGEPYALDIILPEIQITALNENDETPTALSLPCEVHQDGDNNPIYIGVQNAVTNEFNVAHA